MFLPHALMWRAARRLAARLRGRGADYWHREGVAAAAAGRPREAVARFERALKIDPRHLDSCYALGEALRELGRSREALTSYERALSINGACAPALARKAEILSDLALIELALSVDAGLALAWRIKADILIRLRRFREALDCYERIAADDAVGWSNKGDALRRCGRLEEALGYYERSLALDTWLARARLGRAVALDELGRREEAREAYRDFLGLAPEEEAADTREARRRMEALGRPPRTHVVDGAG
ncbi:MAG: tetratricopeptide repeat protein [Acidobacteriota bacterium]